MDEVYQCNTEEETCRIAAQLAEDLKCGDIVLLKGTLGAGKTVFARALIRALCGNKELNVPSPTFTLLQTYDYAYGEIWHFDLYRLKDPEEIYELGWEDFSGKDIALFEWPSRLEHLEPEKAITVRMEIEGPTRHIHISD
ncbi:MAG: tRNA (adenosine(37)-N6)-threonylcarbamoyltransferase complex ATPase subunit type 1 TsaE [Alphaproteobacteria bacterium]|nr:tRNA (adenosine(37)-N6)-threonylcarbamoyltransferase complex ATPase subunit type 1 TsaE [Alphaproteobacteria bacterium]|tara:strand:+ start:37 stop:456 length:420 start_codon:yes stop_codon:yes gene_type:complete